MPLRYYDLDDIYCDPLYIIDPTVPEVQIFIVVVNQIYKNCVVEFSKISVKYFLSLTFQTFLQIFIAFL